MPRKASYDWLKCDQLVSFLPSALSLVPSPSVMVWRLPRENESLRDESVELGPNIIVIQRSFTPDATERRRYLAADR